MIARDDHHILRCRIRHSSFATSSSGSERGPCAERSRGDSVEVALRLLRLGRHESPRELARGGPLHASDEAHDDDGRRGNCGTE